MTGCDVRERLRVNASGRTAKLGGLEHLRAFIVLLHVLEHVAREPRLRLQCFSRGAGAGWLKPRVSIGWVATATQDAKLTFLVATLDNGDDVIGGQVTAGVRRAVEAGAVPAELRDVLAYDWIENLLGLNMHSADPIVPGGIPRTSRFVRHSGNASSRAHPARGRRKLPPAPANPRNIRGGKPRSRRESPPIPAQAASAKTGLSHRRSRVRVPSLPSRLLRCKSAPSVA